MEFIFLTTKCHKMPCVCYVGLLPSRDDSLFIWLKCYTSHSLFLPLYKTKNMQQDFFRRKHAYCLGPNDTFAAAVISFCYLQSHSRGLSPMEEAEWWIKVGLDKGGMEIKFISKEVGMLKCEIVI